MFQSPPKPIGLRNALPRSTDVRGRLLYRFASEATGSEDGWLADAERWPVRATESEAKAGSKNSSAESFIACMAGIVTRGSAASRPHMVEHTQTKEKPLPQVIQRTCPQTCSFGSTRRAKDFCPVSTFAVTASSMRSRPGTMRPNARCTVRRTWTRPLKTS